MKKRVIVIAIFFILMFVVIPVTSGELMIYPKEEGPYTIFISGKCYGGTLPMITWNPFKYPGYANAA